MKKKNCKNPSKKNGKDNSNARFYTLPLGQRKNRYYIWFFLAPGFVLTTSILNVMVLLAVISKEEDKNLIWNAIWNNAKRGIVSLTITILLGVVILLLCTTIKQVFKIKIKDNYRIGKIRKYLRTKQVFLLLYLILFLSFILILLPLNSTLLFSDNYLIVYIANPFLLIPASVTFLVFYFQLLFNPPYKTIGDLLDAGREIPTILNVSSLQTFRNELTMDDNAKSETTSEIWLKVSGFFHYLSDFLEEYITICLKDDYELTSNIMMTWVSEQKSDLNYLIVRLNKILECIENKNITLLINNLQEIAEKAKSSSKKYEMILDFKPYSNDFIVKQSKGVPRIQMFYYFIGIISIIYSLVLSVITFL